MNKANKIDARNSVAQAIQRNWQGYLRSHVGDKNNVRIKVYPHALLLDGWKGYGNDLSKCNTCHILYHTHSLVRWKLGGMVSHLLEQCKKKRRAMSSYTCCYVALKCIWPGTSGTLTQNHNGTFLCLWKPRWSCFVQLCVCTRNFGILYHWLWHAWTPILLILVQPLPFPLLLANLMWPTHALQIPQQTFPLKFLPQQSWEDRANTYISRSQ